jgi:N-carbamoyl-L-amino-acid hydrolase
LFDSESVNAVEKMAQMRQFSSRRITSGAGHDAKYMADICPTAMVFIPCDGGLSHNEAENAKNEHLVAGAQVLLDVTLARAAVAVS